MRVLFASLSPLLLAFSALAQTQPVQSAAASIPFPLPAASPGEPGEPKPATSTGAVDDEVARLRAALGAEVQHLAPQGPERDARWISLAGAALAASGMALDRPQLLVVVDRNPTVQELCLVVARPDGPWQVIGGVKISTGQAGRFDHYVTPVGVFRHTDAVLDFRAEGTFNENHIRGLGLRGMRVWDFGWQQAMKGWRPDHQQGEIRLLMHATDPDRLERRLGSPASQGCVRIPAAMNRFLDQHGIIDADYERAAEGDPRFRAVLPSGRTPTPLAGDALVVVDSAAAS